MAFDLDPRWIGIPYVDRGRDPEVGLDCWGLPLCFYREVLGVELPTLLDHYKTACDYAAVSELVLAERRGWTEVRWPVYGDLVTLKVHGMPWHVGIILDQRHFLHTLRDVGSCVARLDSPMWIKRIDSYWKYDKRD